MLVLGSFVIVFLMSFLLVTLIKTNNIFKKKKKEKRLAASPILYAFQFLKASSKKRNFKMTFCNGGPAVCGFLLHFHEISWVHKSNSPVPPFPLDFSHSGPEWCENKWAGKLGTENGLSLQTVIEAVFWGILCYLMGIREIYWNWKGALHRVGSLTQATQGWNGRVTRKAHTHSGQQRRPVSKNWHTAAKQTWLQISAVWLTSYVTLGNWNSQYLHQFCRVNNSISLLVLLYGI